MIGAEDFKKMVGAEDFLPLHFFLTNFPNPI
jgi:hypothetical protein